MEVPKGYEQYKKHLLEKAKKADEYWAESKKKDLFYVV